MLHDRHVETPCRIEPTRLESFSEPLANTVAEVMRISGQLSQRLHPTTAASLAELLRLTNSYYSNLIEGNATRPRDIERALDEQLDDDRRTRDWNGRLPRTCESNGRSTNVMRVVNWENQLPPPQLHPPFSRWKRSREPPHISCHGASRGHRRSRPVVDLARALTRTSGASELQVDDGRGRRTAGLG